MGALTEVRATVSQLIREAKTKGAEAQGGNLDDPQGPCHIF